MHFFGSPNIHHRDEGRSGLSNTKVMFRYIATNRDFGPGDRFFLGFGLSFPSKNTLKEMRGEFYKWRDENGLGGGNMGFIDVINQKNKQVGYFSYNGRFWRSKNPLNKVVNTASVEDKRDELQIRDNHLK